MKNKVYLTLAMGALMAGCASDEIIDSSKLDKVNADGRISFTQKVGNMTRANTRAELAGHYEFGVWGYKGADANKRYTEGDVMTNYLVAYGDNTTGSTNYKALSTNATTYGADAKEGTTTVAPDGISTWYYESLGSAEGSHKERTSPDAHIVPSAALQSLKYWDKSTAYTNFFAYMPYYGTANANGQSVEIEAVNDATPDLTFNKAGIFVTDPVVQTSVEQQPALNKDWAGTYTSNRDFYNTEIINANEANYAAVSRAKSQYDKDVPLNFHHVNAKIKVAIWEAIPGYKVELIDLINDKVVTANTSISEQYKGVAFTPATKTQAIEHQNHNQLASPTPVVTPSGTTPLPAYVAAGSVVAADVTPDTRSDLSYKPSTTVESNANLRYTIESDDAVDYEFRETTPGTPTHKRIAEVGGTSATVLNTTYYMMPNVASTTTVATPAWITENYSAGYTTEKIGAVTGYTFHVSYRLLPEDGSAPTEVYDARVWVAPEYCRWLDGKQYTYIFKITTSSNGVTDPNAVSKDIFQGSTETDPYIDPEDPRIPDDPALVPIVFDGITVEDYTPEATGHTAGEPDTWQISNVESWPASWYGVYQYRFCNYLTTKDVYAGAIDLSNEYYSTIPSAPEATFVGAGSDPEYVFKWRDANFKAVTSGTVTYTNTQLTDAGSGAQWSAVSAFSGGDILAKAKEGMPASKNFATYKMYIWSNNTATAAWEYTATPNVADITITPTLKKEVVKQTYKNRGYKTEMTYTSATPAITYWKANADGINWDEISESTFKTAFGIDPLIDITPSVLTSYVDHVKTEFFNGKLWKKETTCNADGTVPATPTINYYTRSSVTDPWTASTESAFTSAAPTPDASSTTIPCDVETKTYSFEYSYTVDRDGYTVTQTTASPAPKQAYGVAKSKWDATATTASFTVTGTSGGGTSDLSASFNSTAHTTGTWTAADASAYATAKVTISGATVTVDDDATAGTYTFIYTVDGVNVASVDIVVIH